MKTTISIALLVFIYANAALAGSTPSFESLRAQSHRDARTPEGLAWEQRNAPEGGAKLTPVVNECREIAPEGKDDGFTLLVSLSKHGMPLKVHVSTQTKFAECVRSRVEGFMFSDAPWEGYWLEINMLK